MNGSQQGARLSHELADAKRVDEFHPTVESLKLTAKEQLQQHQNGSLKIAPVTTPPQVPFANNGVSRNSSTSVGTRSRLSLDRERSVRTAVTSRTPSTASARNVNKQVRSTSSSRLNGSTVTPTKPEKIVKKRLRRVETKPKPYDKYLWLAGHIMTIIGTLIYSMYYFTYSSHNYKFANFIYRVAFISVIITYFITSLNQFGKVPPSYFTLLTTENFQYLMLALVWLFNRSSFFKLLPYFLISILHLSKFFKINALLKFEKNFKEIIVYNELFLFVLLTFDTLLFRGTSGYALVIFGMFYSLKIVFSDEAKGLLYSVIIKFDGTITKVKNPKVQAAWTDTKSFLLKKKEEANNYSFHVKR